jgi:two-component system, OmpR family, alkaline phosphatase synthesis response regulator PhoP
MQEAMQTILIADDEQDILEIISHNLQKEGYIVHTVNNGRDAVEKAKQVLPDLVILDVMMPILDGMAACREIKADPATKDISVIFLTARNEEFAEITGFEAGADDYISKPIRPRVLISRIKANLRRSGGNKLSDQEIKDFGYLSIDPNSFLVTYNGQEIKFPRKEFELLSFLASKPGRVFTRNEILENVWGSEVLVIDRTIDVHIRKIREKLEDRFIETVKGVGYKFHLD